MPLKYCGKIGNKKVWLTAHAQDQMKSRKVTYHEVLYSLEHRHVSYPMNDNGVIKIRSNMAPNKKIFVVIAEDAKEIKIITAGKDYVS